MPKAVRRIFRLFGLLVLLTAGLSPQAQDTKKDDESKHGPARTIPNGAKCRDGAGSQRCSVIHRRRS